MKTTIQRILSAAAFIDEHLDQEIRLVDVASVACYSPYHFLRLFMATTGMTTGTYLRRRRLSKAADTMLNSQTRLIEIALEAGFESQAAFSRAFKEMFEQTPGRFRQKASVSSFRGQPPLSMAYLKHLQTGAIMMNPTFETIAAFTVVGMGRDFNLTQQPAIGALWDEFLPQMAKITNTQNQNAYGVCYAPKEVETFPDAFHYTAALCVATEAPIPDGMEKINIAEREYAVFIHKGPVTNMSHTNDYIWKTWFPQSGLEPADAPDFEVYGPSWRADDPNAEVKIYVPVVRAQA